MIANESIVKVTPVQVSTCSVSGQEIFTLILEYPRAIHAQLMTHRVFSKNSSSSRAIPVEKMIEQMDINPCNFVWTENQKGMQGVAIKNTEKLNSIKEIIKKYKTVTKAVCMALSKDLNIHKQNVNRYLEPFTNIKIVLTATDWANWDWLRNDPDAQGEITELAENIKIVRDEMSNGYSNLELTPGEYHVPFVHRKRDVDSGKLLYYITDELGYTVYLSLQEAIETSISCCAQISYRNLDTSQKKREAIIPKLFKGRKIHASPTEHQATPVPDLPPNKDIAISDYLASMPEGVTHIDRYATPCSGNFKNFIQYRQLLPFHDKELFGKDELKRHNQKTTFDDINKTEDKFFSLKYEDLLPLLEEYYGTDTFDVFGKTLKNNEINNVFYELSASVLSDEEIDNPKEFFEKGLSLKNLLDHLVAIQKIPAGNYLIEIN